VSKCQMHLGTVRHLDYDTAKACKAFNTTLSALWNVNWVARHKKTYWGLAVHGLTGAAGHNIYHAFGA